MINWIMICVRTASFTINVNGGNYRFFKGGRGLRQRDPMYLYLFTLVMECFTLMMERNGDVESVKVVRDSIDEFGKCSGLLLNFKKNTIFFGSVKDEVQEEIIKVLPFEKAYSLNSGVNSSYWCTVFLLPKAVLKEINNLLMCFLWCNRELSRGKAKIAWKKICKPKNQGGLVKLNGKNFWEVSVEVNDSWGWKNILEIRDEVSKYVWYKLGDGKNTSMWYDNWCEFGPLFRIVWPREWENDFPIIKQINLLKLDFGKDDWLVRKNKNNKECKFSIREAYKDIRIQSSEVIWAKLLKTLMEFQSNATVWNDIVTELAVKPNKSSIWSIVRRLCLAGVVYSIWRERNNIVFRDEECNWEIVLEMICETMRLKLMGLVVNKSQSSSTSCYQVECDSEYKLHQIGLGRVCLPILGQFGLLHRKMYHKEGVQHCEGALLKEDRLDVLEGECFLSSDAFCICCFNHTVGK
ncbi:hypothetical protein Tco_0153065 [Tanacetum coccineum]